MCFAYRSGLSETAAWMRDLTSSLPANPTAHGIEPARQVVAQLSIPHFFAHKRTRIRCPRRPNTSDMAPASAQDAFSTTASRTDSTTSQQAHALAKRPATALVFLYDKGSPSSNPHT